MDLNGIALYFIILGIGVLIGALWKETVQWVVKMLKHFITQELIKKGLIVGGDSIDVGKVLENTKELIDSEWSITINSRVDRTIGKCRVLLNNEELLWANKNGRKVIAITPHSGNNVRIPKDSITKNARVRVWNDKEILLNTKFEDLPLLE